jgi:hypothetical protein
MKAFLLLAVCVALAAPASAGFIPGPYDLTVCVPVYDFPDNGLAYCIDADGPCLLLERRETFAGPIDTCIVPFPG